MIDLIKRNEEYIDQYRKNGVLFPFRALTTEETAQYRNEFELVELAFDGQLSRAGKMHLSLGWAYDLVMNPTILDYVAMLLGDDIAINGALMFTKYPNSKSYVSWHQDGVHIKWNQEHSLTVFLALSNCNVQNGCLRVIPGSHKNSRQEHVYFDDDDNMMPKSHKVALTVDENKAVDLELQAGEISIHHANIIHGSSINNSLTKRIGFAIRYTNPNYSDLNGKDDIYARGDKNHPFAKVIARPDDFQHKSNATLYKEFLKNNIQL